MQGTLLTTHEAEVRDLSLDIVSEGHDATSAAEMAFTVLSGRSTRSSSPGSAAAR